MSEEFEIESGMPIPPLKGLPAGGTRAVYPFAKMELGQSILVDAGPTGSTVNCRGYHAMKRFVERDSPMLGGRGRKFTARSSRTSKQIPEGKVRIFCIACDGETLPGHETED